MKTLIATVVAVVFAGSAYATDLPRRTTPAAPVVPNAVYQSQPFFVGVHVGARDTINTKEDAVFNLNIRAGFEFSPFARIEASYDYGNDNNMFYRTATVNGIAQYRFGPVVPYILAGGGYRWTDFKNEPVYNVGGGVRYEFTRDFEIDARYRYVTDRDRVRDESIFTLGLNYKF